MDLETFEEEVPLRRARITLPCAQTLGPIVGYSESVFRITHPSPLLVGLDSGLGVPEMIWTDRPWRTLLT
jgi:hypothetical protein